MDEVVKERLTADGPHLSRVIGGCWNLVQRTEGDIDKMASHVHRCCDLGITSFDHAAVYGEGRCEELFGQMLGSRPGLAARVQIITKCGIQSEAIDPTIRHPYYDSDPSVVRKSVERSLMNLKVDAIDVCLIHRPDPLTCPQALAEVMAELRREGKVRNWGVSNYSSQDFEALQVCLNQPLVTNQIRCSVWDTAAFRSGLIATCQRYQCSPMAWSPLGGSEVWRGSRDPNPIIVALQQVSAKYEGIGPEAIAVAWLLRHPARIFPVMGTMNPKRLAQVAAATALRLDRRDWYRLWELAGNEVI